ncbi:MAG: cytochrome c [Nitrospinota bacterium]|nr:cytochrome c [Nitrospinota bacterium]
MKKAISIFAMMLLAGAASESFADSVAGQGLWKSAKCSNCHNQNEKKKVGPGLGGIFTRADEAWVKAWLADSESAWKANEGYTATLKATMGKEKSPKPSHKTRKLTDQEIADLVEFLKTFK